MHNVRKNSNHYQANNNPSHESDSSTHDNPTHQPKLGCSARHQLTSRHRRRPKASHHFILSSNDSDSIDSLTDNMSSKLQLTNGSAKSNSKYASRPAVDLYHGLAHELYRHKQRRHRRNRRMQIERAVSSTSSAVGGSGSGQPGDMSDVFTRMPCCAKVGRKRKRMESRESPNMEDLMAVSAQSSCRSSVLNDSDDSCTELYHTDIGQDGDDEQSNCEHDEVTELSHDDTLEDPQQPHEPMFDYSLSRLFKIGQRRFPGDKRPSCDTTALGHFTVSLMDMAESGNFVITSRTAISKRPRKCNSKS